MKYYAQALVFKITTGKAKKWMLIMKLITIILITSLMQVSAKSLAQNITISEKNITLKQLFKEIRIQTGYSFIYDAETIKSSKPITIKVKAASLEKVLDICFKDQSLDYEIKNKTIILKNKSTYTTNTLSFISEQTISGKVLDENGDPLPGVSIRVKGKNTGMMTDIEGRFSITTTADDILIFSFTGFKTQEVVVGDKRELTIKMEPSPQSLSGVVVIGYGTQKRSDISGAVSTVDMEKAKAIPTTNIAEMIRGQASGVQVTLGSARPGGTSNILIRGKNSIRGGNDPLVVLDGFPIDNINDVSPDDISSIEILKDAASQAIYGSRASNGVILITSKRGKEGKFKINFDTYVTSQKLTKNFNLYSAEEFAQLRREAVRSTNPIIGGVQAFSPDSINFGGTSKAPEYINFAARNYANWEDLVLRTGLTNSNTISINGGNQNTKLYSSINFYNQTGLVPKADYKRGSFRINLDQKLSKKISFSANLNLATDEQGVESSNLDFITISPFTGPYDANGVLVKNLAGANASSSSINPLWNIRESDRKNKSNFFNLNLVGRYQITKNLSYKLNTLLNRKYFDQGTYLSKLHSAGVTPNGMATVSAILKEEYLIENILDYKFDLNTNNKFDFTFVQSINQRNISNTTDVGTGFGNDVLGYNGISNALNFKTTRDKQQYRLSSLLGRARYNLQDKYLLTLTARRDGASVFSENNKWGFFPAASIAWQVHRESFLKNIKTIDQLKVRLSYGSVGNQSLDPYTTLGVVDNYSYIFGGNLYGGNLPGNVLYNPNLTWETSTTFNAGLDFGIFNSRITGSVDYYKTSTTDLLTDISLGGNSGFSSTITNGGQSENRGIEIGLSGAIIRNNKVNWTISPTFTHNTNKLIKTGIVGLNGAIINDLARNRFAGYAIDNLQSYVFDGIFQTDAEALASAQGSRGGTVTPFQSLTTLTAGSIRLKDINGDGVINNDDKVILNTQPKWFSSISTNFQYKRFELLADVYLVQDVTKYNPYLGSFNEGGTLQSVRNGIKVAYWTPENPSTTFPRPNYSSAPANISVLGVKDASYVRLRTLSLAYNLPFSVLNKIKSSSCKVYLTANNLFTITDYKSYSPENNPNDFPDTKSFTFGLNIGF
ncbi:MAG: TonB-dependent receptor [Bacteroidetes bacterium]|nr:TonB-dependent receptor [Bacteroidota bacterium]